MKHILICVLFCCCMSCVDGYRREQIKAFENCIYSNEDYCKINIYKYGGEIFVGVIYLDGYREEQTVLDIEFFKSMTNSKNNDYKKMSRYFIDRIEYEYKKTFNKL